MVPSLSRTAGLLALLLPWAAFAADAPAPTAAAPAPAPAFPLSAYSAFGTSLAQSGHFAELGWNEAQFNAFLAGIRASFLGQAYPMDDAGRQLAAEMGRRIQQLAAGGPVAAPAPPPDPRERLAHYFKAMGKRLGLQVSDSGLGYNVTPGTNGIRPRPGDTIVLTCQAKAADGTTALPQLSADHIRVKMEGMLPGLMEGLQMMTVGSQAVFVLPPALAFGSGTWPAGVEAGAPLVYYVTLHEVAAAP